MEKEETIQCCFIFQSPPVKRLRLAPAPKTTWAAAPPLKIAPSLSLGARTRNLSYAQRPGCPGVCGAARAQPRAFEAVFGSS